LSRAPSLIVVMLAHDIRRVYTFDRKDFGRFSELLMPAVGTP